MIGLLSICLVEAFGQYDYMPYKNLATAAQPMPYYVDDRVPTPAGLPIADVELATTQAWSEWNAVSCAVPKASLIGRTTGTVPEPQSPTDTFNVTPVWLLSADQQFYDYFGPSNAAALTVPLSYAGVLQQCDIFLNGVGETWSTAASTPASSMDLKTVMLHEAGHCLGLDHFAVSTGDVMNGFIFRGEQKRALSVNDTMALCTRYPVSNAVLAPCDMGQNCGNGTTCITQPMGTLPAKQFCSIGCDGADAGGCPFPLSCQASNDFLPAHAGACLLPSSAVTLVGKSCGMASDCNSNAAVCLTPQSAPSGGAVWVAGYCTQNCQPGQPACPAGSWCTDVGESASVCLHGCRVGAADCRLGYACASGSSGGVCVPRCYANVDCPAGFICRSCDGLCVSANGFGASIGDLCTADAQCGAGQQCVALGRSNVRQCTLSCGSACGACPSGSSCHALGGGPTFCARDCAFGTCGAGLQCGYFDHGRGCLPACVSSLECPVGLSCVSGQCAAPGDLDGGCVGQLCPTDAGAPIEPSPADGGQDVGTGGCGCSSSSAQSGVAWAVWLFVAYRRRSSRVERRTLEQRSHPADRRTRSQSRSQERSASQGRTRG